MLVTRDNFPNILLAFHAVEEDNSGPRALRLPVYQVPDTYPHDQLSAVEEALSKLSKTERAPESPPLPPHVKPDQWIDSEFYTYVNGEHQEQLAIANRNMALTVGYILLNDFFDEFEVEEDDPIQRALRMRAEYFDSMGDETGAREVRALLV